MAIENFCCAQYSSYVDILVILHIVVKSNYPVVLSLMQSQEYLKVVLTAIS